MTVETSVLTPGARVAGRYVVEQLVRRAGAMSVYVARADSASTARFVARVLGGDGGAADAVAVVNRELQRVAMLRQRAVPTLVAVARDPAGLVVLTERPEGQSLREHLEKNGRMRPNEVARVVAEVAMVLDALHAASPPIVHRAVSPDTIAIAERMLRVWVEECGLAQALTASGLLAPSAWPAPVAYLSPAELAGAPSAATDVFSLASVAYECLVGAPAFRRDSDVETEALVRSGTRPSAVKERADVSADVDTVLQRAWSNEGVYASAGAFARELSRVLLTNPTTRASVPIVAKPRAPAAKDGAALMRSSGNKSTLLGMAPGATTPGDSASNPLKSTLLGMGIPRAKDRPPSASTPRAAPHLLPPQAPPGSVPVAPPGTAPIAPAATAPAAELAAREGAAPVSPAALLDEITDSEVRARIRRPTQTTQRVEVPRIRPPGTEPIGEATPRVKVALMPAADSAGRREPPPRSDTFPASGERISDGSWGDIEANIDAALSGDDPTADESSPTMPSEPPAAGGFSATPATFDIVSNLDFEPVVPAQAPPRPAAAAETSGGDVKDVDTFDLDENPAPERTPVPTDVDVEAEDVSDDSLDEPEGIDAPPPPTPVEPPIPIVPMGGPVAPPLPIAAPYAPPLPSAPMLAPTPPAMPMTPPPTQAGPAPFPPLQPAPTWSEPGGPVPPADMTARYEPVAARPPRRAGLVLGLTAVVALVAGAGGIAFLKYREAPQVTPPPRVALRPPTKRLPTPRPTLDAAVAAQSADASALVAAAADAVAAVAHDSGVGEPPADVAVAAIPNDASEAPEPTPDTEPDDRHARRHSHPRSREIDAFIASVAPAVQACVNDPEAHRHVRVDVTWEGSTGRVTACRVASRYAAIATCVERAVRAGTIAQFTDDDYSTNVSFDPN